MSEMKKYLLGHNDSEKARLNTQSEFLRDPYLEPLLRKAKNCLEVGCGVGSNVDWILSVNPKLKYTGVDLSPEAIATATREFSGDQRLSFKKMNATSLTFQKNSFDLVFTKLALWAIGKKANLAINEAFRVLKPAGKLHVFEPDDSLLMFLPEKKSLNALLKRWQSRVMSKGMDPLIGKKLTAMIVRSGFRNVTCSVLTNPYLGINVKHYKTGSQNIKKIYFGRGPSEIGLKASHNLWQAGMKEIDRVTKDELLLETYFVVSGKK